MFQNAEMEVLSSSLGRPIEDDLWYLATLEKKDWLCVPLLFF